MPVRAASLVLLLLLTACSSLQPGEVKPFSIGGCVTDPHPTPVKPGGARVLTSKQAVPEGAIAIYFDQSDKNPAWVSFEIQFTPASAGDVLKVHPYRPVDDRALSIQGVTTISVSPTALKVPGADPLKNRSRGRLVSTDRLDPRSVRVSKSPSNPNDLEVTFTMQNVTTGFTLRRSGLLTTPYWNSGFQPNDVDFLRVVELAPMPKGTELTQRIGYFHEGSMSSGSSFVRCQIFEIFIPDPKCAKDYYEVAPLHGPAARVCEEGVVRLAPGTNWLVFRMDRNRRLYFRPFQQFDPVIDDPDRADANKVDPCKEDPGDPRLTWQFVGHASEANGGLRGLSKRMASASADSKEHNRVQLRFTAFGCVTGIELRALQLRTEPCWLDPNCKDIEIDPCEGEKE